MAKRKPTSELTDRNWDEEEEPEEAGTFRLAEQNVLQNRTIRKAKRTINAEKGSSGSVFAGFALTTADSSLPKPSLSTGVTLNFNSNLTFQPKPNGTAQASLNVNNGNSGGTAAENPDYLRQLRLLNENILTWIQKHVGENPYCILTPSFKDYEQHLSDLEKKYGSQKASQPLVKNTEAVTSVPSSGAEKSVSTFGAQSKAFMGGFSDSKPLETGFSFGKITKDDVPKVEVSPASVEEDTKAAVSIGSGFSFGTGSAGLGGSSGASAQPFSFSFASKQPSADSSASTAPAASGSTTVEGEDEYEPPKTEVREIKEDGAVYTKRCKLFYQKDGQWVDRGVGNLHLKFTEDGRTQLVLRADTNLGNILLNIMLTAAMPTQRQGKNNVFFVCVPNPPIDPKKPSSEPTPMLLRVKTAEDADELLAKLEELKASA